MKDHPKAVSAWYSSKLQTVLNCLEDVSKRGDHYRSKCPSHGGNNKSILSIGESDAGGILLHCFHGCSYEEVRDACGLTNADLMPERLTHKATPEQRRKWKQDALHRDWAEFVKDLVAESRIVYVANLQLCTGQALNSEDSARLKLAMERIAIIGGYFSGQR